LGGGGLYGLAPEFERMGLFFNLNLFEKQGVPFPKERMNWVEVLRLASRFPTDGSGAKRIHGLSIPSPSTPGGLIDLMGRTNQLNWMDSANEKLTLQTAAWQEVWNEVLDGVKRGAMLWEKQPGKNPFLAGQVAMTLQPFRFVSDLQQQAAAADLSWDVLTEPAHPSNPDVSATFDIPMIFAVNAQSPYAREAWELVKFINSKEIAAKQMRERTDIPLLARRQQLLERVKSMGIGGNIDAFYRLKPQAWDFESFNPVQGSLRKTLVGLIDQEVAEVLEGRKPLAEALESLEVRARETVLRSRGEPNR
jgi:multiple sugar transport system substrate-binding protein